MVEDGGRLSFHGALDPHLEDDGPILTPTKEFDFWLEDETVVAPKLQRPLPDRMPDIR